MAAGFVWFLGCGGEESGLRHIRVKSVTTTQMELLHIYRLWAGWEHSPFLLSFYL